MDKKKIVWITADYFIDVDLPLVPVLRQFYDIDWVLIRTNPKIEIPPNEDFEVLECFGNNRSFKRFLFYYRLLSDIFNRGASVVYIDYFGMPYFYPLVFLLKKKNVELIHAAHNVIPYDGWPNKRLMTWYVNYIFRNGTHFQVFSEFLFSYFKMEYPLKGCFYAPLTLKNYGEVTTNKYHVDSNKINLLFFGNVKGNKRLDLIINAMHGLPENLKTNMHLTIAGTCDEQEVYFKQINSASYISCFFQRVKDEEVAELFSKHQYLILPYENVAQSGPHMIAYNYNLPVIASDIDGFRERVIDHKTGFLFDNANVDSLTRTLTKVATVTAEEYTGIKNNLADFVASNYSVKSVVDKYKEYFDNI